MSNPERKYADLIFHASRKYPNWDPEIPVRCGDYGRITLGGRPAWMFWRRRQGIFVKEGNIYDDGKAKEYEIPAPGEFGAHESEGLTWVTSENGEEIDIHSSVSCQTPALMSCKIRAAFKFTSGNGAILVMLNDSITSIEPASSLRRLLDNESMKGLVIVSQVHSCASYARLLTAEGTKTVAIGLNVETPAGDAAGAEGEAKWVRSTNTGNFKTRVNNKGSRDFYPLFKLVSIVDDALSTGLRGEIEGGDPLPDAEPPWPKPQDKVEHEPDQEPPPESQPRPGGSEPNIDAAGTSASSSKPRFKIPFLS